MFTHVGACRSFKNRGKMLPANRWFVLIVFCIGLATVEPAVRIISPVKDQIIKYRNQSILFNCTVTPASKVSGTNFQWFRNDTPINNLVNRTDTNYWSSFEVKGLSAQDEGEYMCIYGGNRNTVTVHLAAKPKVNTFGNSSPVSAEVNKRTELECEATGWPVPKITWIRNGQNAQDINQDNQYDFKYSAGSSELGIVATQKEDEGKYICMARNALGEDNGTIVVEVEGTPVRPRTTMKAEEPKYTAVVGTEAKLVCIGEEVQKDPFTFVFWKFNGTNVQTSSDHYLITNDFYTIEHGSTPKVRTQLSVLDVRFADTGNYTCIVSSDRTKDENDTIVLEVRAKAKLKTWMIAVIAVVAVIVSLLLAAVIIVICWRRRRKKKLLAMARKYDQEDNHVYENDLFVSYSTKDYDWVKQSLLSVLDENGIKYIIHSRDFVPGKAWLENMADSVYNSRKVILVMSTNYLSSGFCKDEMQMAMHRSSERDDSSLILVRIDNIKSSDIPASLRHRTFIDVTSKEEETTWQGRILEYVRSDNRTGSVTSEESSINESDTKGLLAVLKLKRKKKRGNVDRELENQA